ncbi:MAG: hypothetical protein HYZ53_28060 [Planctomycetes bacterium]|nr:hypothetical protein [Planctomycetota bacterium]
MMSRLSVSQARQRLPQILRALEHSPGRSFEILRRGKPIARLSSVEALEGAPRPWTVLLRLGGAAKSSTPGVPVSETVDQHLADISAGKAR